MNTPQTPKTNLAVRLWADVPPTQATKPTELPDDFPGQVIELEDSIATPEERALVKISDAVLAPDGTVQTPAVYEERLITEATYAPISTLPYTRPDTGEVLNASDGWQVMTREAYATYRADPTRASAYQSWQAATAAQAGS